MGARGWIRTDQQLTEFARNTDEILNKGCYLNLCLQLNKAARHSKGVSIQSQRMYYHHMDLFLRFLSDEFHLKNLSNISGKHIAAFVEERQHEGKSASTVKNVLVSIRYFHDQLPNPRHRIPSNQELFEKYGVSLERRAFGRVNRRWTWQEVNEMIQISLRRNRHDVAAMIQLGAGLGLRIHEIVRLERANVESALRCNVITVKGKGGLIRDVPLTQPIRLLLQSVIADVPRGYKLFVPPDRKAHEIIQSVQMFIRQHRERVEENGFRPPGVSITFHGLRHLYAYERFTEFIKMGYSESAARLKVAELIGHSREDVTRIYLIEEKIEDGRD